MKLKQIQCKSNTDGKKIIVAVLKLLIKLYVSVKTITFWIRRLTLKSTICLSKVCDFLGGEQAF